MPKQSKDAVSRIKTLLESWRTMEPGRTFYGHTLAQFETAVQPVFAVREEGADLAKRVLANAAQRKDVEGTAVELMRNIVHAVKADPAVGENSLLYAAMGYVRRTDRVGGRKRPLQPAVASPKGDAKPAEPNA